MKILVTGKNGQLGSEMQDLAKLNPDFDYVFMDRTDFNLENIKSLSSILTTVNPNIIVNAAAYTAVDKAETEQDLADKINHLAVGEMAKWCKQNNSKLVHISTDYVFAGNVNQPLKETDEVNPINIYGKTKQLGEEAVLNSGCEYVILRTSWVYSVYGANFVKTMIRLMKERDDLSVVSDQYGSPTYAKDLAEAILKIVKQDQWHSGIYHFSNKGETNWYEFALKIKEIAELNCVVSPIFTKQYPTPAKRPNYSLLDKTKIEDTFKLSIPHWQNSLQDMINALNNI